VARSGDSLEDFQPGRVGQGFRYLFDLGSIHKRILTLADPRPAGQSSFRPILTPIEITCNRTVRHSSKYRNLKREATGQDLETLGSE
jgi:hypothetical protein